jgi:hypothetical protein
MVAAERPRRMPWDDQPFVDHKAAAQRAIAAAQPARTDVSSPAVTTYARNALDAETRRLESAPDGTRNSTLFSAARNLFELVAAGVLGEPEVLDAMRAGAAACGYENTDGISAVEATLASGRRRGMDNPRDLSHVGQHSTRNGFRPDVEAAQTVNLDSVPTIERGFWTQRESLRDIYLGALSRMCSPWAVLGFCAARALALVRPNCVLPPLIGGPGSLNWFCAIAAPSGGGKGSAGSAAKELVKEYVRQRNLGSGEGIVDAYVKPADKETGEPPGLHESVMFVADEIDTMHALGSRAGSTLPAILRSGFSGEALGFSYRQASKLHLEAQTYRMTLAVSVQPARAGMLMDDSQGGTLQRFMWFPGVDPRVTAEIPAMPGALQLPMITAWQYPRELKIPYEAVELIRDERSRAMRGENDVIDGHALFIREKFAYALAVLDGRDEMSLEDWVLAGIAARVSDHTRSWVAAQLEAIKDDDAAERGRLQGVSSLAADEEKSFRSGQRTNRIASWALGKMAATGISNRELSRAIMSRDRPYLPAVLEMLRGDGLITQDERKRWWRTDV